MTALCGHSFPLLLCVTAILAIECAPALPSGSSPLSGFSSTSRDGVLQYRVPTGWFDASADSEATGHAVWLICSDLEATLALDEVHIDRGVRGWLDRRSLTEVARLLRTLRASWEGLTELAPPECITLDGREVCTYLLARPSTRETHRVILLDTGRRVYTVTLVMTDQARDTRSQELMKAQDAFVESVQW